jgi:hypothetical protein
MSSLLSEEDYKWALKKLIIRHKGSGRVSRNGFHPVGTYPFPDPSWSLARAVTGSGMAAGNAGPVERSSAPIYRLIRGNTGPDN